MEVIVSQNESEVVVEEIPVIEDLDDKSMMNRIEKMAGQVSQSETFGEFDLFGSNLTLNFQGETNYKTEFGGIIFLAIFIISVTLTVIYVFPNGLSVSSYITQYSLLKDTNGQDMTIFDNSDEFMRLYVWNSTCGCPISGGALKYMVQNVTAWQVADGKAVKQLEIKADYKTGYFYLNKTPKNADATINAAGDSSSSIRIEALTCDLFDVDPVYGMCMMMLIFGGNTIAADFVTFVPKTNGLISTRVAAPTNFLTNSFINVDVTQFTTNNKFFGYIANILNYQIDYYNVAPVMYPGSPTPTIYSSFADQCWYYGSIFRCVPIDIIYSGTTNIATENFDDITAPMLFFISLSQTLFFLAYLCFLGNYSNNAFRLALADSLVYIPDLSGRHYNFKSGPSVFLACMVHGHFLIKAIDFILYRICQTHTKKFFSTHTQMAMSMIDYGYNCLVDTNFYGELNDMYSQENTQPQKIIFNYDQNKRKQKDEEEKEEQEPEYYFEDKIKEEAFKRMCQEHQYYSVQRKTYLRDLLLQTSKRYKLVLIAQKLFEEYCTRVRDEGNTKQLELPINFQEEELSGHNLKKDIFY